MSNGQHSIKIVKCALVSRGLSERCCASALDSPQYIGYTTIFFLGVFGALGELVRLGLIVHKQLVHLDVCQEHRRGHCPHLGQLHQTQFAAELTDLHKVHASGHSGEVEAGLATAAVQERGALKCLPREEVSTAQHLSLVNGL